MNIRKGIILAGGSGTRLYPSTISISKQIIPIYDKPMIYYSLSTLMEAGIKDILIISSPDDIGSFKKLLKSGKRFGINIDYAVQAKPEGLAQAFIIGEDFLDGHPSCLILGDNIFYGAGLSKLLQNASADTASSSIFSYKVADPERFGVVEFDDNDNIMSIQEKPNKPSSSFAVTGLYFFDEKASQYSKALAPSERGELEITDLINIYLEKNKLKAFKLSKGFAWLDTGTPESLLDASNFVSTIEKRQGSKICCPEEIAFKNKWITRENLLDASKELNPYNNYLRTL
jgi:glucose-1-phosphate thymidylyltransferase